MLSPRSRVATFGAVFLEKVKVQAGVTVFSPEARQPPINLAFDKRERSGNLDHLRARGRAGLGADSGKFSRLGKFHAQGIGGHRGRLNAFSYRRSNGSGRGRGRLGGAAATEARR